MLHVLDEETRGAPKYGRRGLCGAVALEGETVTREGIDILRRLTGDAERQRSRARRLLPDVAGRMLHDVCSCCANAMTNERERV